MITFKFMVKGSRAYRQFEFSDARAGHLVLLIAQHSHGTSFTQKAGNLRRRKVENCKSIVLVQPQLSLLNR
jgi:hypothetical protein